MKLFPTVVGVAGLLAAGSAYATPGPGVLPGGQAIFSSFVTNAFNTNTIPLHVASAGPPAVGGSPDAQEFTMAATSQITSLTFELSDPNPGDGGSILVYLVPNGSGNVPPSSGLKLTGASLLGTINDSSLTSSASAITIGTNAVAPAGTDWIALVDASDTLNGGTNTDISGALWYRAGDLIGLNVGNNPNNTVAGLFNAHVVAGASVLSSVNTNVFELQIDTPEPASLALLAAGVTGLGFVRRHRSKKSAG